MKKIAFICGGNSVEKEISCLTGLKISKELTKNKYEHLLIYLNENNQFFLVEKLDTDFVKNNYLKRGYFIKKNQKCYFKVGCKKYYFDYSLVLGHGKNIEEGVIKNYLEQIAIPSLGEDIYNGVIIQDKAKFKMVLKANKIASLPNEVIYKYQIERNENLESIIKKVGFPMIIKPSTLGSSIGVSIANNKNQLQKGLLEASMYDNCLIVEPFITDKIEYNIAIIGYQDELEFSNIELVNQSNNVLSFYDKYDYSKENEKRIINPIIAEDLKQQMIEMASKLFKKLNLCGIVRFDFIYDTKNEKLYLNEANLIPGSLAYYLFEEKYSIVQLIDKYINILEQKEKQDSRLNCNFQEGFMTKLDLSKLKK